MKHLQIFTTRQESLNVSAEQIATITELSLEAVKNFFHHGDICTKNLKKSKMSTTKIRVIETMKILVNTQIIRKDNSKGKKRELTKNRVIRRVHQTMKKQATHIKKKELKMSFQSNSNSSFQVHTMRS